MDILQLDKELRSNQIRPGYWLIGEEAHLVLTAKKHILKAIFKETKPMTDVYSAAQTPLGKILDSLNTPSLLTPHRCVVVEDAEKFKKEAIDALAAFFKKPPPQTFLVLLAEDFKAAALKKFPAAVGIVECKKLYPRQASGWVNMELRGLGVPISKEAADFLVEWVGCELGMLHQTLEQLVLYVGKRKIIQVEDVEAVAARSARKNVFDLTQAIGEQKPAQAIRWLQEIFDQGEEPVRVLGMIARHCRLLASAQAILAESGGAAPADLPKQLGVHPFFAKDYVSQARRWSKTGWPKCFERLALCDRSLKSSRNRPQIVLEKLIWELCS